LNEINKYDLSFRKMPIQEFHLSKVLEEMEMSTEEFIDLCILLGCDYCGSIKGIGPKTAIKLIKEHKTIEKVLSNIDTTKNAPPEDWLFKEARNLFINPEVTPADKCDIKWTAPKEDELVQYMATEKGFAEDRIRNGVKKILKAKSGSTQGRLDSFFKVLPSNKTPGKSTPAKRKIKEEPKGSAKKKTKTGGGGGKFKAK